MALFSAALALQRTLATLRADGSPHNVPALAYAEFTRVVDLPFHQRLDEVHGAES